MSTKASNFVSWLLEDINAVHAEVGTPRDEQLREFVRHGFLKFRHCIHGTNDYEIVTEGFRAFWDAAAVHSHRMPGAADIMPKFDQAIAALTAAEHPK